MKVLKKGQLSIRDDSPWTPGKWRKATGCIADGYPCADAGRGGFHTLTCADPLKSPAFAWPCEVWEDECRGLLGQDETKARYRQQRIVREITNEFPVIVSVNEFLDGIVSVHWLDAHDEPEPWMRVASYPSIHAAGAAAGATAWATAWAAARDAAGDAAGAAARDAAGAAAGVAYGLLVADLGVDTTWLHRWWRAWETGYYPIHEDGDVLVVGRIEAAN